MQALGCSACHTHHSTSFRTQPATGRRLCNSCHCQAYRRKRKAEAQAAQNGGALPRPQQPAPPDVAAQEAPAAVASPPPTGRQRSRKPRAPTPASLGIASVVPAGGTAAVTVTVPPAPAQPAGLAGAAKAARVGSLATARHTKPQAAAALPFAAPAELVPAPAPAAAAGTLGAASLDPHGSSHSASTRQQPPAPAAESTPPRQSSPITPAQAVSRLGQSAAGGPLP